MVVDGRDYSDRVGQDVCDVWRYPLVTCRHDRIEVTRGPEPGGDQLAGGDGGIGPAHCSRRFRVERRHDHPLVQIVGVDPSGDGVGHLVCRVEIRLTRGVLDFDVDDEVGEHGKRFVERRYLGVAVADGREVVVDQRPHLADVGVVVEHDHTVGGEADIELDPVGTLGNGELERLDRVVRGVGGGAPMAEYERLHDGFLSFDATLPQADTIPAMRIFNTLGRALQDFEPRDAGKVGMYVCGATVQSKPHVGHGRYAVVFDVVRRYFEWLGYEVTYVRNITDVDDKIIAAANEMGVTIEDVVAMADGAFQTAYEALRVRPPDIEPRATDHIPEMIEMIEALIERDHAYAAGGDVYFSVRSFPEYGKLSGRNIDELRSGERIEPGEYKRDPLDFALWKGAKPGEPKWGSPWGPGRPGWHIECSAMSHKYLGTGFDIHGGGHDLIFPHHENEITQAEGAGHVPFARFWMHNGLLNLSGEKMSKSTGHVIDLVEGIETYSPGAVRLFYLRTHYRKPLEFSEEALTDARASLDRIWAFRRRVPGPVEDTPLEAAMASFREAMDNDLDNAGALAVLFDVIRDGNRRLDGGEDAGPWVAAYDEITGVLGLDEPEAAIDDLDEDLRALATGLGVEAASAEAAVEALIELRAEARENRDWATADQIRDGLKAAGIILEDTADGIRWHRG